MSDGVSAASWLSDVQATYTSLPAPSVSENVVLMISSTLLHYNTDTSIAEKCLDTLCLLAKLDSGVVQVVLPLLLFILNKKKYRAIKLTILYALPKFATDKSMISAILKTILLIAANHAMLPVALRMMTTLWNNQPRIFPYLQQLLGRKLLQKNVPEHVFLEWMVARCCSLLDVCRCVN